ncbi:MAG: tetratricopeptide repeat protein [Pseudomonadota bacterium]|nr:MAG: hypothetical protein DIU72_00740 [Pseudomonadota bacterium]
MRAALVVAGLISLGGATHAGARAIAGLAEAEEALSAWDVPRAAVVAERLVSERPDDPRVLHLLGRVRHYQGRYAEAAELFRRVGDEDLARLAADTHEITKNHQRQESEHFVFLYPPGKDEILAPWALETLEAAWERVGELLGYRPEGEKIRVEVVQSAEELARVSTLSLEAIRNTGTIAVCKFDKLMVTSPRALLRGYDWRDTLSHEYIHLVITRKSRNRTPIWLHEGIAKFMETAWRGRPGLALHAASQTLLQNAVEKDRLITFDAMHPSIALLPTAEDAALAFAEVFTAVEFLYERDEGSVARLLEELAAGRSDREAVAAVFGRPFPIFEAEWRRHLRQRDYPDAVASLEETRPRFREDGATGDQDPTELSEFRHISDAEARRNAHLGELLRARGKLAAAAAKFERAFERVGARHPSLSNKYAMTLLALEETERAIRILEKALAAYPDHALTNLNMARAQMQKGNASRARPFLESSLSVNPFDPELFYRLLAVAREDGDEVLAARSRRAIELLGGRVPEE